MATTITTATTRIITEVFFCWWIHHHHHHHQQQTESSWLTFCFWTISFYLSRKKQNKKQINQSQIERELLISHNGHTHTRTHMVYDHFLYAFLHPANTRKKNRINITTFESKFHFLFHFFDPNVKHHSSHSHSQTDTLTLCLIKFRNLFIHSFIWPIILWMSLIMEQINRNWMRQNERMREKSLMTENMERNYSSRIKNLWCSFQWMDGWINHKKEKKIIDP